MKKRNVVLSLFISLLLLTGCAGDEKNFFFGGQQDPLSEKDQAMGDGTKDPQPVQGTKPIQSDAIRIDTVDFYSFLAGQAGEFKINGRVLIPDYEMKLEILNAAEFDGATYDAATGLFKWTPNENLVTGADTYRDLVMQVQVVATKPGNIVLMGTRNVAVRVNRVLKVPDIVTAGFDNTGIKVREGTTYSLTVMVNDPSAAVDQATWPTLLINSVAGSGNLVEYLRLVTRDRQSNGQIRYVYYLDLTNTELTKSYKSFGLSFKAVSMFNKFSVEKTMTFNVFNKLVAPQTTWTSNISQRIGTKLNHSFMVLDPKDEGVLSLGNLTGLPAGMAQPVCTTVTTSIKSCVLSWDIPVNDVPRTITMSQTATLASQYPGQDNETSRSNFTYSLTLTAAPISGSADVEGDQ
jgi:hypothetical protein